MTKKKNITLTEFFCGGGGLGLGFKQAGVDILKAYDFDKFAIESYKHNVSEHGELKSVTDLKGEDIPKSDVWTFGFPCFPEGTLILCKDGIKDISEVKEGDYVLTHKNRWKKVIHTMAKVGPVVELKSEKTTLITTEEHPFYALENKNDESIKWIQAKEMKNKYWSSPIEFESFEKESLPLKENNRKLYWLLGYLVSNSQYVNNALEFETIRNEQINDILQNLNISYEKEIIKKYNFLKISKYIIKEQSLINFFLKQFKNLSFPTWLLFLDKEYKEEFINGFVFEVYDSVETSISISFLNKGNAHIFKMLLESINHTTAISHFKKNIDNNVLEDYWYLTSKISTKTPIIKEGHVFDEVTEYTKLNQHLMVYNLEVEDDNSYIADGITVHNCQDISVAGKMAGMVKGKTRSGLFYEIMRLLEETKEENKPKIILAENVKQVKNYFEEIEKEFNMQDYTFTYVLYNSKYFNVAQNRERYFMLGVHKSVEKEFKFKENPVTNPVPALSSFLEKDVPDKFYLDVEKAKLIIEECLKKTKEISGTHACLTPHRIIMRQNGRRMKENEEPMFTLTATEVHGVVERKIQALGQLNMLGNNSIRRVYNTDGISPTLTTAQGGNTQVKILEGKDVEIPLEELDNIDEITKYFSLRRLTPREYARLQGFPDTYEQIVSNSQFYKQMGNAVTVNVAQNIAEQIIEFLHLVEKDKNKQIKGGTDMNKENQSDKEQVQKKTQTSELFEKGNYKKKESKKKKNKEEQEKSIDYFNDKSDKNEKKKSKTNTINKIVVWTLITGLLGSTLLSSLMLLF